MKVDAATKVTKIEVAATATAAKLDVSGTVTNVTTSAAGTQVSGTGTVSKVEAQAGAIDSKIETKSTQIVVAAGVTGVTAAGGTTVTEGTSVTNSADGTTATTTPTTTTPTYDGGGSSTTPITAVAVTGTASVGQTLTASMTPSGATASFQWTICDTIDGTYADITGATSSTYVVVAGDVGKYVKVSVTGTGSYTGSVTSNATAAITTTAVTAIAAISGTAAVGSTLTAGALTPAAATVSYQWTICDTAGGTYSNIGSATNSTYVVAAGDVGKFIKVAATGTGGYTGTVTSAATSAVTYEITAIGAISGTVSVGSTLTAGTLTPAAATVSYQWTICDTVDGTYTNIGSATNSTYVVAAGDVGKFIKVAATGTGSYTGTVTSAATSAVTYEITAIGAITGTASVGSTLTAGILTPAAATVSYQWTICDTAGGTYSNISSATNSTYVVAAGDVGKFIKVVATGTGSYTGTVTSAATSAVTYEITAIGAITGTASVGSTLTAGALTPVAATVSYQWMSCDTVGGTYNNIADATNSTYTLVAGDTAKYIKVVATGTGSYIGTVTSAASALVTYEITGYDAVSDVNEGKADNTTHANAAAVIAALPTTLTITGTSATVPVTWADTDSYDASQGGTYVFTGTIGALPTGYVDAVATIATVTVNVIVADNDNATLSATSTVKGETIDSLGTPNADPGSVIHGAVTITSTQAADTSNTGSYITAFVKTDSDATVTKVVKYASGADASGFATDTAYNGTDAIAHGDYFVIYVTAEDTTTTLFYIIDVTVQSVAVTGMSGISETELLLGSLVVHLALANETFADGTFDAANFTITGAPAGTTITQIIYMPTPESDPSVINLQLQSNTEFDTDATGITITIAAAELSGDHALTTGTFTIEAEVEHTGTVAFDAESYSLASDAATTVTVTLTDADLNSLSGEAETWSLTVNSNNLARDCSVSLTETGLDTGVFTGTFTIRNEDDSAYDLYVRAGDSFTVTYTDPVSANRTEVTVTDTASVGTVTGTVAFNADSYAIGAAVTVTVTDADLNMETTSADDMASVTISSPSDAQDITIIFNETGANTGVFSGTFYVGTVHAGDTIVVADGDTITVTCNDAADASGSAPTTPPTDTATIDGTAPTITAVALHDITGGSGFGDEIGDALMITFSESMADTDGSITVADLEALLTFAGTDLVTTGSIVDGSNFDNVTLLIQFIDSTNLEISVTNLNGSMTTNAIYAGTDQTADFGSINTADHFQDTVGNDVADTSTGFPLTIGTY